MAAAGTASVTEESAAATDCAAAGDTDAPALAMVPSTASAELAPAPDSCAGAATSCDTSAAVDSSAAGGSATPADWFTAADTMDSRLVRCVVAAAALCVAVEVALLAAGAVFSSAARPPTTCSAEEESPLCSDATAEAVASLTKEATAVALANTGQVTMTEAFAVAVAPYLERTVSRSVMTLPPAAAPAGSSAEKIGESWKAPTVSDTSGTPAPSTM